MKRAVAAALIALALCPLAGAAQQPFDFESPSWGPRVRLTPFVGFALGASRLESWTVTAEGQSARGEFDVKLASGPAAGMALEIRAFDRFGFVASGVLISRGKTVEYIIDDAELFEHEGSNFLFAKAAAVIRLREATSEIQVHSVTGSIFVGPAWAREMPKHDPFADPIVLEPLDHWGLSFGFDAEIPLPYDMLSFNAGMEDWVIWWNTTEFGRRNDLLFAASGLETVSFVESGPSHNLLFRAGFSLRF